jgi:hypothetical protein
MVVRFRGTLVACGVMAAVALLSACEVSQLSVDPPAEPVQFVAYTSTGEIVVFHDRNLVRFSTDLAHETGRVRFDGVPESGKIATARLSADGQIVVIAWSPDARWAPYPENGVPTALTVEAFRLTDSRRLLSVSLPNMQELELSPAGDLLAVYIPAFNQAPPIRTFELYAVDGGALLWSSPDVAPPFVFSPDGAQLYGNMTGVGKLGSWSVPAGEVRYTTPIDEAPGAYYSSLAISRDGQRVIGSGSLDAGPPAYDVFARFTYRRAGDGQVDFTFSQLAWFDGASAIVTSPDGVHWAAVTQNVQATLTPAIQIRDTTGTVLYTVPTSFGGLVAFSPDGQNLIATNGSRVTLHRSADGSVLAFRSFTIEGR